MLFTQRENLAEKFYRLGLDKMPLIRTEKELLTDRRERVLIYKEKLKSGDSRLSKIKVTSDISSTNQTVLAEGEVDQIEVVKKRTTITIYTDGSCLGNPGRGGWAAVFADKEISGGEKNTTNNRMELTAVIQALKATEPKSKIELFTDSNYVKDGITSWIKNWKKNGWKTSNKKPVLNKDLWQQLDKLVEKRKVKFNWIKGHSGNELNERCDILAKEMTQNKNAPAIAVKERRENFC